ncbi:hypothetical protein CWM85_37970, partial [Klebsiella michiganensis]
DSSKPSLVKKQSCKNGGDHRFFFLPQHNGKTQSCSEAKASSAAKNHTPDDGKYTISLYILVFMTIG